MYILEGPAMLAGVVQNACADDFQVALTVKVFAGCDTNLQVRYEEPKIFVPENVMAVFPLTGPLLGKSVCKDNVSQNMN